MEKTFSFDFNSVFSKFSQLSENSSFGFKTQVLTGQRNSTFSLISKTSSFHEKPQVLSWHYFLQVFIFKWKLEFHFGNSSFVRKLEFWSDRELWKLFMFSHSSENSSFVLKTRVSARQWALNVFTLKWKLEFWSNRELKIFQCFENLSFDLETQVLMFWVSLKLWSKSSKHDFALWKKKTRV